MSDKENTTQKANQSYFLPKYCEPLNWPQFLWSFLDSSHHTVKVHSPEAYEPNSSFACLIHSTSPIDTKHILNWFPEIISIALCAFLLEWMIRTYSLSLVQLCYTPLNLETWAYRVTISIFWMMGLSCPEPVFFWHLPYYWIPDKYFHHAKTHGPYHIKCNPNVRHRDEV